MKHIRFLLKILTVLIIGGSFVSSVVACDSTNGSDSTYYQTEANSDSDMLQNSELTYTDEQKKAILNKKIAGDVLILKQEIKKIFDQKFVFLDGVKISQLEKFIRDKIKNNSVISNYQNEINIKFVCVDKKTNTEEQIDTFTLFNDEFSNQGEKTTAEFNDFNIYKMKAIFEYKKKTWSQTFLVTIKSNTKADLKPGTIESETAETADSLTSENANENQGLMLVDDTVKNLKLPINMNACLTNGEEEFKNLVLAEILKFLDEPSKVQFSKKFQIKEIFYTPSEGVWLKVNDQNFDQDKNEQIKLKLNCFFDENSLFPLFLDLNIKGHNEIIKEQDDKIVATIKKIFPQAFTFVSKTEKSALELKAAIRNKLQANSVLNKVMDEIVIAEFFEVKGTYKLIPIKNFPLSRAIIARDKKEKLKIKNNEPKIYEKIIAKIKYKKYDWNQEFSVTIKPNEKTEIESDIVELVNSKKKLKKNQTDILTDENNNENVKLNDKSVETYPYLVNSPETEINLIDFVVTPQNASIATNSEQESQATSSSELGPAVTLENEIVSENENCDLVLSDSINKTNAEKVNDEADLKNVELDDSSNSLETEENLIVWAKNPINGDESFSDEEFQSADEDDDFYDVAEDLDYKTEISNNSNDSKNSDLVSSSSSTKSSEQEIQNPSSALEIVSADKNSDLVSSSSTSAINSEQESQATTLEIVSETSELEHLVRPLEDKIVNAEIKEEMPKEITAVVESSIAAVKETISEEIKEEGETNLFNEKPLITTVFKTDMAKSVSNLAPKSSTGVSLNNTRRALSSWKTIGDLPSLNSEFKATKKNFVSTSVLELTNNLNINKPEPKIHNSLLNPISNLEVKILNATLGINKENGFVVSINNKEDWIKIVKYNIIDEIFDKLAKTDNSLNKETFKKDFVIDNFKKDHKILTTCDFANLTKDNNITFDFHLLGIKSNIEIPIKLTILYSYQEIKIIKKVKEFNLKIIMNACFQFGKQKFEKLIKSEILKGLEEASKEQFIKKFQIQNIFYFTNDGIKDILEDKMFAKNESKQKKVELQCLFGNIPFTLSLDLNIKGINQIIKEQDAKVKQQIEEVFLEPFVCQDKTKAATMKEQIKKRIKDKNIIKDDQDEVIIDDFYQVKGKEEIKITSFNLTSSPFPLVKKIKNSKKTKNHETKRYCTKTTIKYKKNTWNQNFLVIVSPDAK